LALSLEESGLDFGFGFSSVWVSVSKERSELATECSDMPGTVLSTGTKTFIHSTHSLLKHVLSTYWMPDMVLTARNRAGRMQTACRSKQQQDSTTHQNPYPITPDADRDVGSQSSQPLLERIRNVAVTSNNSFTASFSFLRYWGLNSGPTP
jgi:hypothetical protein